MSENPILRYHNRERGYVRCRLTPTTWTTDYLTVPFVSKPNAPLQTRATFVTPTAVPRRRRDACPRRR